MNITEKSNSKVEDILQLMKSGDENIKLEGYEDIILLIGNTGAGKTTLTHFIAGSTDDLVSEEVSTESRDYIIVDKKNKISNNSTTISHTLYPDLFVDSVSKAVVYDCPGFSDTRSAKNDISSSYFVKKVLDSAKRVKFILVVNHSSVRKGVDRQDFMLLLKHVTDLIPNIEKFKGSLALIATKVDNIYIRKRNRLVLVTDEKVIKNIGEFLSSVRVDLRTKIKSLENETQPFLDKATKLIEILLEKEPVGDDFKKIGIFRRPEEPGPLSNITSFQTSKKKLQNMIQNNLVFTLKNETDFGYTVSAESKIYIKDLGKQINTIVSHEIAKIGKRIEEHFFIEEAKSQNVFNLFHTFKNGTKFLSEYDVKPNRTLKSFAEELAEDVGNFRINNTDENINNIMRYNYHLNFLKTISNETLEEPTVWFQGLKNTLKVFKSSEKWYEFLINLHNGLSTYAFQRNIHKYNETVLMHQNQINGNKEVKINSLNLKPLIDKLKNDIDINNIESIYNEIQEDEISDVKIQLLKKVLDLNFNHKLELICGAPDKLVIRGNYVKLTDIIDKQCEQKLMQIEVFASNKIFIDSDLNGVGKELYVSIIAPIWEIIGDRKILLDGQSGVDKGKAQNGQGVLASGMIGEPGLPGGAAGNFLGISGQLIGKELVVSANGGRGGRGEDGGDGAPGVDGVDPPKAATEDIRPGTKGYDPTVDWTSGGFSWTNSMEDIPRTNLPFLFDHYVVLGKEGTDGGNGGDGGAGGIGGNGGTISIVDLSNSSKIIAISKNGEMGNPGFGGNGGSFARNGRNLHVRCMDQSYYYIATTICQNNEEDTSYTRMGIPGLTGSNTKDRLLPEDATISLNPLLTIKKFNDFINTSLSFAISEPHIKDFYNRLRNMDLNIQETSSTGKKPLASALESANHHRRRRGIDKGQDYNAGGDSSTHKLPFMYQAAMWTDRLTEWLRKNITRSNGKADSKYLPFKKDGKYNFPQINQPKLDDHLYKNIFISENSLGKEGPNSAYITSGINKNNEIYDLVDNISQALPSNLLLWDLIVRKYNKDNKSYSRNIATKKKDFSHDLAYSHYSPTGPTGV